MRQLLRPAAVTAFVLLVLALKAGEVAAQGPGEVRGPRVPKSDAVDVPYSGTVTDVTKESITIQWTATPGEKPKTFLVSEILAAGKSPMEPRLKPGSNYTYRVMVPYMYRLTDVKVGDWVGIKYSHFGDVDICEHICIKKRPGGRIPPLPEEAEALRKPPTFPGKPEVPHIRYEEFWNAYWDLEDKGIPFPEKFGKNRRFPVAPMPREKGALPAKIMQ